jgi:hypothetical protein
MTSREDCVEKAAANIRKMCNQLGFETPKAEDFFVGLKERYFVPSLSRIVEEELPQIIQHDTTFFDKHQIDLPEKLDVAIFNLYYDRFGADAIKRVTYSAKVWFRHLRFFLVTHPDERELEHTVQKFKEIINGNYFNTPRD